MAKFENLTGMKFNRLTVIKRAEDYISPSNRKRVMWFCKCDCGNITKVSASNLKSGGVKSCGCLVSEIIKEMATTHGGTGTRLHRIYRSMRQRCYDKNSRNFHRYGGRGIEICNEWLGESGFEHFREWANENGYRSDLTIDRINNDGNYEPNNCRWATYKQQGNNTSRNVHINANGETHTLKEWSEILNVRYDTLLNRRLKGWTDEQIITTPVSRSNSNRGYKNG